jgi:hypothetical protein
MIEDVVSIYNGKPCDETTFSYSIKEHILASEYGWSLDYMRNMKYSEFEKHFSICYLKKKIEIAKSLVSMGVKNIGM